GPQKAFCIVTNEESSSDELPVSLLTNHGQDVDDGKVAQKMIGSIVQHISHGSFRPAHDPFHAIYRAKIVAAIDAFPASGSDQNVLVVVGHADDLVWHYLPNRDHEIEGVAQQHAIHLRRPGIVQLAFRLPLDKIGRHLTDSLDVAAPIVST